MAATYHLNPGELTDDFLRAMQVLFHDRQVKVTIEVEDDETAAIRANPELHEKLLRRLRNVEAGLIQDVNLTDYITDASPNV